MKILKDHRTWAILIFGVALILRLAYLLEITSSPYFYDPIIDEAWNLRWAESILAGNFWGDQVYFRGPLYPYLLAVFLAVTGSELFWVRLLQALIGCASVVLTYNLGRRLFSETVARIASAAHALYGMLIFYETMLLIPVIFIFLNQLGLYLLIVHRKNKKWQTLGLIGLIFGLAAIARPNILLVMPLLAGWVFWERRRLVSSARAVFLAVVFLIGAALAIAPVTVRNYIVADDFVLISSQGGINLYLGNNASAEGLTMMMPEIILDARVSWSEFVPTTTEYAEAQVGHALKPSEVSAFWSNKAKQFIFENPFDFIGLTFRKLVYLFSGFENSDQTDIYQFRQYSFLFSILVFDTVVKFPFGLVAPLALLGLGVGWRRRKDLALLYLFLLGYIPTIILFLVTARHRLALIPILLLFAAMALLWIIERIRAGNWRRLAVPGGAVVALVVLLNINLFDLGFSNPSQTAYNQGLAHMRQGQYDSAVVAFQEAVNLAPGAPVVHHSLASAYLELGQLRPALAEFNRAVTLDPKYGEAHLGAGIAYLELGRYDEAGRSLRIATRLNPDHSEPWFNLGEANLRSGQMGQARDFFLEALQRDTSDHIVLTKLGVLYGQAGDTATSFDYFRRSLEIAPSYAPGYLNWGNIYLINGDTASSLQRYRQSITHDPDALEPHFNLALLHLRQGNIAAAREQVEEVLRIDPTFEPGIELQRQLRN